MENESFETILEQINNNLDQIDELLAKLNLINKEILHKIEPETGKEFNNVRRIK